MDAAVLRSLAKWPDVPAAFGWLALDRRGRWLVRGEPIGNAATRRFIDRNYAADAEGRWYFQNGPQRVYVRLEYTPWVYRLDAGGRLVTHTGAAVERVEGAWIDDAADLLLATGHGPGLVDDRDLAALAAAFCDRAGRALGDAALECALAALAAGSEAAALYLDWGGSRPRVGFLPAREVPARFGFDPEPAPADGDGREPGPGRTP